MMHMRTRTINKGYTEFQKCKSCNVNDAPPHPLQHNSQQLFWLISASYTDQPNFPFFLQVLAFALSCQAEAKQKRKSFNLKRQLHSNRKCKTKMSMFCSFIRNREIPAVSKKIVHSCQAQLVTICQGYNFHHSFVSYNRKRHDFGLVTVLQELLKKICKFEMSS